MKNLYVVKRDDIIEPYVLVSPMFNTFGVQDGWITQKGVHLPFFADDVIITKIEISRILLRDNIKVI